jgi:hypothetical protein
VAQVVRRRASPELLSELADLIDGQAIASYVADLQRARDENRSGTVSLTAEISFGRSTDAWNDTHLRPRKVA